MFKENLQPASISNCKTCLVFPPNAWLQRASFEHSGEKGLYHCSIYIYRSDLPKFKAPQIRFYFIKMRETPLFTSTEYTDNSEMLLNYNLASNHKLTFQCFPFDNPVSTGQKRIIVRKLNAKGVSYLTELLASDTQN